MDSGVSKGTHIGLASNQSGWHGSSRGHDGISQRGGGGTGAHRHWNGNFHSRKGSAFQEKPPAEAREEKEEKEKLQFEEDDFVSEKFCNKFPRSFIFTDTGKIQKFRKLIFSFGFMLSFHLE